LPDFFARIVQLSFPSLVNARLAATSSRARLLGLLSCSGVEVLLLVCGTWFRFPSVDSHPVRERRDSSRGHKWKVVQPLVLSPPYLLVGRRSNLLCLSLFSAFNLPLSPEQKPFVLSVLVRLYRAVLPIFPSPLVFIHRFPYSPCLLCRLEYLPAP